MVEKPYQWSEGAELAEHSKKKFEVLREYFYEYLLTRCKHPMQRKFRIAIIDFFAGGGVYKCGTEGSPLIFIDTLQKALEEINIKRKSAGAVCVNFECLLIFNDINIDAVSALREVAQPRLAKIKADHPELRLEVLFFNEDFASVKSQAFDLVLQKNFQNILVNLDQCGHSKIDVKTLSDMMNVANSVEVFLTFSIDALNTYLPKSDLAKLKESLRATELEDVEIDEIGEAITTEERLGVAERVVFRSWCRCAKFVSPFSIHNPKKWKYWLLHFAKNHPARRVYNDVSHRLSNNQAHYGRSGLNMLSYDPSFDGSFLYLFDEAQRIDAKNQLMVDIPKRLSELGRQQKVGDFLESIYNETPAHHEDILTTFIDSPELTVLTDKSKPRRAASQITLNDHIELNDQRVFHEVIFHKSVR